MKRLIKGIYYSLCNSWFSPFLAKIYSALVLLEYDICCPVWRLQAKRSAAADPSYRHKVVDEVTFIFKSFERQDMAKRLYRSIQRYYPGARVIIADDSKTPLKINGPEIIQFPFNSGLSRGIQACLDRVQTEYTVRMDDDMLITPLTRWEEELFFLETHPEIDLSGIQLRSPNLRSPRHLAEPYLHNTMNKAGQSPRFPVGTPIDAHHFSVAKSPNTFIARTDAYRKVGYDENIRMIDHHEFFYRAVGVLACVTNVDAFVFHYPNRFHWEYRKYRNDYKRDVFYIRMKHKRSE